MSGSFINGSNCPAQVYVTLWFHVFDHAFNKEENRVRMGTTQNLVTLSDLCTDGFFINSPADIAYVLSTEAF